MFHTVLPPGPTHICYAIADAAVSTAAIGFLEFRKFQGDVLTRESCRESDRAEGTSTMHAGGSVTKQLMTYNNLRM